MKDSSNKAKQCPEKFERSMGDFGVPGTIFYFSWKSENLKMEASFMKDFTASTALMMGS